MLRVSVPPAVQAAVRPLGVAGVGKVGIGSHILERGSGSRRSVVTASSAVGVQELWGLGETRYEGVDLESRGGMCILIAIHFATEEMLPCARCN